MDLDEIKRLLSLMAEHDLVEVELAEGDKKVRLRKAEEPGPAPAPVVVTAGTNGPVPVPAPAAPPAEKKEEKPAANVVEIRSPLVGTFYAAAKPGADPFVNVGDAVGPEKVVCIVEAMKVMNEIKAEVGGRIKEVLARNGQPVEFNEVLFTVEKAE